MVLKFTPQLHFHLDTSVVRGTKIMEIMRQVDEVTPPESAEDAERRMDAYAAGDVDRLTDLDPEETADLDEADEEAAPVETAPEKTKAPRSIRDAKGRGKQDGHAAVDDDE